MVKCWGRNDYGQLGDGSHTAQTSAIEVRGLGGQVISVSTGGLHSCALLSNKKVQCWGWNYSGQLGNGGFVDSASPVTVYQLDHVKSISASSYGNCAILDDGSVKCWGSNYFYELGDGTGMDRPIPISIAGLQSIVQIARSARHSCALRSNGEVYCWGQNLSRQTGSGTSDVVMTPARTYGLPSDIKFLRLGGDTSCAVQTSGATWCWGYDVTRPLDGNTYPPISTPKLINMYFQDLTMIVAGAGFTRICGVAPDKHVYCWGANDDLRKALDHAIANVEQREFHLT